MTERKSGILLHIISLPGEEGIGTLGGDAFRFVDFLEETNQKLWQILPLGHSGDNNSPYQYYSAFAGNPLLIDLYKLTKESLIAREDLQNKPRFPKKYVDFAKVKGWKLMLLRKVFDNFQNNGNQKLQDKYKLFLKKKTIGGLKIFRSLWQLKTISKLQTGMNGGKN